MSCLETGLNVSVDGGEVVADLCCVEGPREGMGGGGAAEEALWIGFEIDGLDCDLRPDSDMCFIHDERADDRLAERREEDAADLPLVAVGRDPRSSVGWSSAGSSTGGWCDDGSYIS